MVKINYPLLKRKNILKLVEPSINMSKSYFSMSQKFFESAKLLLKNNFFESSTNDFYYSAYHSILALFFFCGIKSENHNASINLIKDLFKDKESFQIMNELKEERIDKQYYHKTKASLKEMQNTKILCQKINLKFILITRELNKEKVKKIREEFAKLK